MWLSLSEQTAYFLWSLLLGAVLAVAYDLVRAMRMLLRAGRVHVLISDVLFFVFCGVCTSLFALPFNKGDVRGFIIFGETVGFLAYRLTLGSIMGKIYAKLSVILRKIVQKICKILENIFSFLLKVTHALLYNIGVVIDRSRKSTAEKRKLHRAEARKRKAERGRGAHHKRKDSKHEQKGFKKADRKRRKTRG